jgi:hypothetical protein
MKYLINGKEFSRSKFIKNMIKDLSKEYLFTSDILSNYLNEKNIDINNLNDNQVFEYTNELVNNNLTDMLDFITNNDSQVFNSNKYFIEE